MLNLTQRHVEFRDVEKVEFRVVVAFLRWRNHRHLFDTGLSSVDINEKSDILSEIWTKELLIYKNVKPTQLYLLCNSKQLPVICS